jgi:hypothetical protein
MQLNREASGRRAEPDLETVAGTDVAGQLASVVATVRASRTPNDGTRRDVFVVKNREGALGAMVTNFTFSPMNFEHIPGLDPRRNETDHQHVLRDQMR